jgi:hypothetical protein
MPLTELLTPDVLLTLGVAIAFALLVVLGVALLRLIVARRNPDLVAIAAEADVPGASPGADPDAA